jgi:hypothetical protein
MILEMPPQRNAKPGFAPSSIIERDASHGRPKRGVYRVPRLARPADTPAMPGMLQKSTVFVPRYQKFEPRPGCPIEKSARF